MSGSGRRWRASRLAFIAPLALGACAHAAGDTPGGAFPTRLELDGGLVALRAAAGADPRQLPELAALVAEGLPAIAAWGGLAVPTEVVVVPDHAALEQLADRRGYGWLRAWARYDRVYLQAPATWGRFGIFPGAAPPRPELRELLTHELTHCAMYQAAADPQSWSYKQIPLWFREGLASWTAGQASRRLTPAALAARLRDTPALDPLANGEPLSRSDEPTVYAAAHWGFGRLLTQGADKIRSLLAAMHAGATYPEAFAAVYGESAADFERRLLSALRADSALAAP